VDLLGIQPRVVAFVYPVSPEVQQAVAGVYAALEQGQAAWEALAQPSAAGLGMGTKL
jgi:hypothetical protein